MGGFTLVEALVALALMLVGLAGAGLALDRVRERVAARLPAYMAPREIRGLAEFPLNANGKVDRKALLALLAGAA